MNYKNYLLALLFCWTFSSIWAQKEDNKSFAISNVTIHVGNGVLIENAAIGVKKGKIEFVGKVSDMKPNAFDKVVDGKGQHVYPGFIAPNTQLGLIEVEAVRATADFREIGNFNPNIRSIIAYNTDSDIIPTIRTNGILYAQIVPQGGQMSGQSSVVKLEAYNWEDALVAADNCIHLNWPNRISFTGWWAEPGSSHINKNYSRDVEGIRMFFDAALAYSKNEKPEKINQRFEAMKGVFNKSKKLFLHVDDAKSMLEAYELLRKYGVELVYVGAAESWRIADFLKSNDLSVILGNLHSLPRLEHDDFDQPFKTPAILKEKGVKFALSMEGSWNQRNLMFQAGQAVAYGLSKEDALASITLHSAQILGIDKQLGSLELGKDASFIVSLGDALDMRTSIITEAYIQGKLVNLNNKQKVLYDKYMEKFDLPKAK